MKMKATSAALVLLTLAVGAVPASAQVLYGSVVGVVEDQSGAVVPNAQVEATSRETGLSHTATSDTEGNFNIGNLPPGTYNIRITAPGFRTLTREGLVVRANEIARAN